MKINAVLNLIKKHNTISCGMNGDEQWIAAGEVAYNISSLPELNGEQLLTMMGLSEKKKAEYEVYDLPPAITHLLDRANSIEKMVGRGSITICINDSEYEPVIIENRVYFIDVRYYKPFEGIDWDIYAVIDKKSREVVVTVKAGFLYLGYIMPTNIRTEYIAMDLALITETLKRQKEADMMDEFPEEDEDFEDEE